MQSLSVWAKRCMLLIALMLLLFCALGHLFIQWDDTFWIWTALLISPATFFSLAPLHKREFIRRGLIGLPTFTRLRKFTRVSSPSSPLNHDTLLLRAFDSAAEAIVLTDLMGCILYANRNYLTQIGNNTGLVDPQNEWRYRFIQPRLASQILDAVSRERVWSGEVEIRTASGRPDSFLLSASPVYEKDGIIRGMLAIHTNISAQKRDIIEYRRFASLVENGSVFIAMMSLSGEITYLNKAGRRMIGLDPNDPKPRGHLFITSLPSVSLRWGIGQWPRSSAQDFGKGRAS